MAFPVGRNEVDTVDPGSLVEQPAAGLVILDTRPARTCASLPSFPSFDDDFYLVHAGDLVAYPVHQLLLPVAIVLDPFPVPAKAGDRLQGRGPDLVLQHRYEQRRLEGVVQVGVGLFDVDSGIPGILELDAVGIADLLAQLMPQDLDLEVLHLVGPVDAGLHELGLVHIGQDLGHGDGLFVGKREHARPPVLVAEVRQLRDRRFPVDEPHQLASRRHERDVLHQGGDPQVQAPEQIPLDLHRTGGPVATAGDPAALAARTGIWGSQHMVRPLLSDGMAGCSHVSTLLSGARHSDTGRQWPVPGGGLPNRSTRSTGPRPGSA